MAALHPVLDSYVHVLEKYFRLVCQMWLERVERHLQAFAEALDQWLHDLFQHPTPDWRERFNQFLAQQLAEGRQPTA